MDSPRPNNELEPTGLLAYLHVHICKYFSEHSRAETATLGLKNIFYKEHNYTTCDNIFFYLSLYMDKNRLTSSVLSFVLFQMPLMQQHANLKYSSAFILPNKVDLLAPFPMNILSI